MRRFLSFMADVLWQMVVFHLVLWVVREWLRAEWQAEESRRFLRDLGRVDALLRRMR